MQNMNIKDIAKIAGVAPSTVSRVLNNRPDVSERTRKRILAIMEQYNYIPNNSARNLKMIESNAIGVLVKGIYNPFFSKIIQSIEEKIAEQGYSMTLNYNYDDSNDIDTAITLIKEKRLEGLICLGGNFEYIDEQQILSLNTPIVIASANIIDQQNKSILSSVTIDNEKAAFEAVDYLCNLGHTKIGMITTGESDRSIGRLRIQGYKKALQKHHIKVQKELMEIGEYTFDSGFNAMERLFDKDLGMTALFATSDIMAIGAAKAALSRGFIIPDDISIVGFDDIEYTRYFHPSLTTIKQPQVEIGYNSVEILFDILKKEKEHRHVILKTELVKRNSCKQISKE
ncbi:MAG: LacI family transcriptional regulator [Epulopiscium sp.]|nr:LacI family transcriptional regulator [Candidatus Epulonipiscium sp.]